MATRPTAGSMVSGDANWDQLYKAAFAAYDERAEGLPPGLSVLPVGVRLVISDPSEVLTKGLAYVAPIMSIKDAKRPEESIVVDTSDLLSSASDTGLPEESELRFKPFQGRDEDYAESLLSQARKVNEAVAKRLEAGIEKYKAQVCTCKDVGCKNTTPEGRREYINQWITNGTDSSAATRFDRTGIRVMLETGGGLTGADVTKYSQMFSEFPLKPESQAEGKSR